MRTYIEGSTENKVLLRSQDIDLNMSAIPGSPLDQLLILLRIGNCPIAWQDMYKDPRNIGGMLKATNKSKPLYVSISAKIRGVTGDYIPKESRVLDTANVSADTR